MYSFVIFSKNDRGKEIKIQFLFLLIILGRLIMQNSLYSQHQSFGRSVPVSVIPLSYFQKKDRSKEIKILILFLLIILGPLVMQNSLYS